MVYIKDIDGRSLMPTKRHGKVRWLLKENKAVVINLCPFTIQLTYKSTDHKQPVTLGIDAGAKHIGFSATAEKEELFACETTLRTDIVDLLSTRLQNRRTRRSRLRYRKPRFNNRGSSKKKGWVAPSVKQRIDSHLNEVNEIHKILPITKIVIEVAQFDTQKMKNHDISGSDYQNGEQLGFWNVREYVLFRDGHKCSHCKGKSKDPVLNVHHLESRKTGGDSPSNLVTLCESCHKAFHKGEIELKKKRGKSLRDAAVMGIMKWKLYEELKSRYDNVSMTFGYITKYNRIKYGIEKSHTSDAFVISRNFNAKRIERQYLKRLVRRHNRQIHKMKILKGGKKKNNQAPFGVFRFRLFDKVLYNNEICFIYGRRKSGNFNIRDFNGENPKDVSYKKLKLIRGKMHPIILK
jgi:hypothetical protein